MNKEYEHIINSIEKKMKTLMIGSIARFEQSFGYLWNHGHEPTNEKEEFFRDKWEDLRYEILNHGINQIRLGINELIDYTNMSEKYAYQYKFIMKQNGE